MTIGGVLSAIGVGLVIGYLGRFVAPKSRRGELGLVLTIVIGIVSAVLGTAAARGLDIHRFGIVFAIQVLVAALFVCAFSMLVRGRAGK
jgi:uncharacterized membrane protein YeaQ/YmgE (transglycosylase-associated protein family)